MTQLKSTPPPPPLLHLESGLAYHPCTHRWSETVKQNEYSYYINLIYPRTLSLRHGEKGEKLPDIDLYLFDGNYSDHSLFLDILVQSSPPKKV